MKIKGPTITRLYSVTPTVLVMCATKGDPLDPGFTVLFARFLGKPGGKGSYTSGVSKNIPQDILLDMLQKK